jgi:hypothetical protein
LSPHSAGPSPLPLRSAHPSPRSRCAASAVIPSERSECSVIPSELQLASRDRHFRFCNCGFSQRAQRSQRTAFQVELVAHAHPAYPSTVPNALMVRRRDLCPTLRALRGPRRWKLAVAHPPRPPREISGAEKPTEVLLCAPLRSL